MGRLGRQVTIRTKQRFSSCPLWFCGLFPFGLKYSSTSVLSYFWSSMVASSSRWPTGSSAIFSFVALFFVNTLVSLLHFTVTSASAALYISSCKENTTNGRCS